MNKYINFNNKFYKMEFSNHHAGTRKFLAKLNIFELTAHEVKNNGVIIDTHNILETPSFYAYFGPTVATRKKCDYCINVLENKITDTVFKRLLSMINFEKCKGGYRYNITNILVNVMDLEKEQQ